MGIAGQYSLERYHINGSRILSRSFHVEKWTVKDQNSESDEGEEEPGQSVVPLSSTLEIRIANIICDAVADDMDVNDSKESEDEDEEREDTADVGMTPMADMLNARHGCDNVRRAIAYNFRRLVLIPPRYTRPGYSTKNKC